jgi:IclR family acetate operon transcriptional repressor
MSKSNSFSILQTLIARGYVADDGEGMTRRYRLTPALAQLAVGALVY